MPARAAASTLAWWARRSPGQQDLLFYALLVLAAAAGALMGPGQPPVLGLLFALVGPAPVLVRRRRPRAALTAAGGLLLLAAALRLDSSVGVTTLAVLLVTSLAADARLRPVPVFLALAGVVNTVTVLDAQRLGQPLQPAAFIFGTVGSALSVGLGTLLRRYRATLDELAGRNAELERLRILEAQRAVADERTRIARELHDVVAHHVSAIAVRAQAAAHVQARRPEEAGAALAYVTGAAGETLTALRRMVGVLRTSTDESTAGGGAGPGDLGGAAGLAPQPGLAQLPALLERMRATGMDVTLHEDGEPAAAAALPADAQLAVYRIVQESLTNALRHAPGAPVEVRLGWTDRRLSITVTNGAASAADPASPARADDGSPLAAGGHGLVGMRERLAAYDGTLRVGPLPGGSWRVAADLPVPAAAAARIPPRSPHPSLQEARWPSAS